MPPASVQFVAIGHSYSISQGIHTTTWEAVYNGVTYYGFTEGLHRPATTPPNQLPAPNETGACYLIS